MTGKKGLSEAWDSPLDESIHRARPRYVDHFDDPRQWQSCAWIYVTDEGREADRIGEKYFTTP